VTPAQPPGRAGLKARPEQRSRLASHTCLQYPFVAGPSSWVHRRRRPKVARRCVWNQVARLAGAIVDAARNQLASYQYLHAGGLDVVDMLLDAQPLKNDRPSQARSTSCWPEADLFAVRGLLRSNGGEATIRPLQTRSNMGASLSVRE